MAKGTLQKGILSTLFALYTPVLISSLYSTYNGHIDILSGCSLVSSYTVGIRIFKIHKV